MNRRNFLISAGALAVVGCASRPTPRGVYEITEVEAPVYRVGDRWVYRRTDGYNGLARGTLSYTVMAVGENNLHIEVLDENGRLIDDARYAAPGLQVSGTFSEDGPVTGRCDPPYREYDFPLVAGKQWRQNLYLQRTDPWGTRNYVSASCYTEGWVEVEVAGQTHRALIIRRSLNLGQKSFFEGTMYRYETEWYVPALRGFARMETREDYYRRRSQVMGISDNGDRFLYELQSFEPGA